jgi:hypothetical protein
LIQQHKFITSWFLLVWCLGGHDWILWFRSNKDKLKVLAGLHYLYTPLRKDLLQVVAWNQFLAVVQLKSLFPCWMLANNWHLPLDVACIPFPAFQAAPNMADQSPLLLISLSSPYSTSLLLLVREHSLPLRANVIRFGHQDNT